MKLLPYELIRFDACESSNARVCCDGGDKCRVKADMEIVHPKSIREQRVAEEFLQFQGELPFAFYIEILAVKQWTYKIACNFNYSSFIYIQLSAILLIKRDSLFVSKN